MSGKKVSSDTCRNLILDVLDSKTSARRLIARLLGRMMIGFYEKQTNPLGFGTLTFKVPTSTHPTIGIEI